MDSADSAMGAPRRALRGAFDAVEIAFDRAFPAANHPWRQLGAIAYWLFWIVAATGIYLYAGFDTSADGAYASVERIGAGALPLGALARSVHRYASDALLVVVLLHLAREWARGRDIPVRRYTWVTGVVALWLLLASGIGGFWLVWDALAQYSLAATLEWLDALPPFDGALVRNVVANDAIGDRLFSLMIFLHIGLPLALLAAMFLHVLRLARPATRPPRALALGTLAALVALALARPVASVAPADASVVPATPAFDWFYLGVHAFQDHTSPETLWVAAAVATATLLALPSLKRAARDAAARIDLAHCNGCTRCAVDCPYAAIAMRPRSDGRPLVREAVVDADLCAACGVCVGACPSSTPSRAAVTGIDLPGAPLARVRARLDAALARLAQAPAGPRIVVFGCPVDEGGADLSTVDDARTATVALTCAGQLPPSFVAHALDAGADGVVVAGCRGGDCGFRLGDRYAEARLAGERAPRLRRGLAPARVRTAWVGRRGEPGLRRTIDAFRSQLAVTRSR